MTLKLRSFLSISHGIIDALSAFCAMWKKGNKYRICVRKAWGEKLQEKSLLREAQWKYIGGKIKV